MGLGRKPGLRLQLSLELTFRLAVRADRPVSYRQSRDPINHGLVSWMRFFALPSDQRCRLRDLERQWQYFHVSNQGRRDQDPPCPPLVSFGLDPFAINRVFRPKN